MTIDRFPVFIDRLLSHEGGFTDDRRDPGNWTGGKVGVTSCGAVGAAWGMAGLTARSAGSSSSSYRGEW